MGAKLAIHGVFQIPSMLTTSTKDEHSISPFFPAYERKRRRGERTTKWNWTEQSTLCCRPSRLTDGGFVESTPCLEAVSDLVGESGLPPVFFSALALLKITVNPSADAGSLTSHSPNFGNGRSISCSLNMKRNTVKKVTY